MHISSTFHHVECYTFSSTAHFFSYFFFIYLIALCIPFYLRYLSFNDNTMKINVNYPCHIFKNFFPASLILSENFDIFLTYRCFKYLCCQPYQYSLMFLPWFYVITQNCLPVNLSSTPWSVHFSILIFLQKVTTDVESFSSL